MNNNLELTIEQSLSLAAMLGELEPSLSEQLDSLEKKHGEYLENHSVTLPRR